MSKGVQFRRSLTIVVGAFGLSLAQLAFQPLAGAESELQILRLGTGGTGGTYFPIGSILAQALSTPIDPENGDRTGVPDLLLVPQISNGSVSNVKGLSRGLLDLALVQSDVAYWAYNGTAIFNDQPKHHALRAVANLYPESMHLVARKGSGIESVANLKGKRVSLDEVGSGTVVDARIVLHFYDLEESDLKAVFLKPFFAARQIANGELDAFFLFAGYPAAAILDLAATTGATLVPIDGPAVEAILHEHPYFARGVIPAGTYGHGLIPAGTYKGVGDTPTLTVGAQLLVNAALEEDFIYQLTRALWSTYTQELLIEGHPKGKEIKLKRALEGVSIPLHPGAARFYREMGDLASNEN